LTARSQVHLRHLLFNLCLRIPATALVRNLFGKGLFIRMKLPIEAA